MDRKQYAGKSFIFLVCSVCHMLKQLMVCVHNNDAGAIIWREPLKVFISFERYTHSNQIHMYKLNIERGSDRWFGKKRGHFPNVVSLQHIYFSRQLIYTLQSRKFSLFHLSFLKTMLWSGNDAFPFPAAAAAAVLFSVKRQPCLVKNDNYILFQYVVSPHYAVVTNVIVGWIIFRGNISGQGGWLVCKVQGCDSLGKQCGLGQMLMNRLFLKSL